MTMVKVFAVDKGIVISLGMKHSCVHRYLKKRLSKRCKKMRECPSATSLNHVNINTISDNTTTIPPEIDNYSSFKSLVGVLHVHSALQFPSYHAQSLQ